MVYSGPPFESNVQNGLKSGWSLKRGIKHNYTKSYFVNYGLSTKGVSEKRDHCILCRIMPYIQAQGTKVQPQEDLYSDHWTDHSLFHMLQEAVGKYDLYEHNWLEYIMFQVSLIKFVRIGVK